MLARDERGVIMLMTVLVFVVMLVMLGIGVDLARVWVAREQAQTAVDAAALAGARNAVRHVTVSVAPGYLECDLFGCRCVNDSPEDRSGTEKRMVEQKGWRHNACDKYMGIRKRWLEYPSDTGRVASELLRLNYPSLLETESGGERASGKIKIYDRESDMYYPSVVAAIKGNVKTTFLKIVGIDSLPVQNCGQATSFYNKVEEGIVYGRNKAVEDSCKEER